MTGSGKARSDWNACLLRDALGPLYAHMLAAAAMRLGPTPEYWALWPSVQLPAPWSLLSQQLYREVCINCLRGSSVSVCTAPNVQMTLALFDPS